MYPVGFSNRGLTKLWVVWKDGHKKTICSFDSSGHYEVKDPKAYGIRGLKKTFAKDFNPPNVDQARIYDTTTGQELERYQNGQWVPAPHA